MLRAVDGSRVEILRGNLLSRADCAAAVKDVAVTFHLAAGAGSKSFADAYLNSVVTTRNLLDAIVQHHCLRRFVNVSSLSVYTNQGKRSGRFLDENCQTERRPSGRGDAYCFAKSKQDELLTAYARTYGIPYVIVRPGYVYGPGKTAVSGRVGTGTFGLFLHLGGSNPLPLTFVDNCADAIARAGLTGGIDGEVFNIVDDDLPSSRRFLSLYKRNVRKFKSVYIPHALSYLMCMLWERYSEWSQGQLPLTYNRRAWHAYWKRTYYRNDKLRTQLGWRPIVSTGDGLRRYFEACREESAND
jgi:nucleoside-diphosphate-sugar epimerase